MINEIFEEKYKFSENNVNMNAFISVGDEVPPRAREHFEQIHREAVDSVSKAPLTERFRTSESIPYRLLQLYEREGNLIDEIRSQIKECDSQHAELQHIRSDLYI